MSDWDSFFEGSGDSLNDLFCDEIQSTAEEEAKKYVLPTFSYCFRPFVGDLLTTEKVVKEMKHFIK